MHKKVGTVLALAASAVAAGVLVAPSASALPAYVCTTSHSGNTGSAKCADLATVDRYRAKVICVDSRGVQTTFYGPWKPGRSGEWSSYTCPGSGFFYHVGFNVELG
ncbi:hypothetical protein ACIQVO_31095 [Streptomyces sp. NPDC101062]|uniref:hypothetical protein n=1 Tax=unclassified Streptomyces TaxID=2593676 RepID=UPI002E7A7D8D|nr:hypothetical protein [Streptomyces sp. JV176]MEE1799937.1 hypothetical protein [Streptomyces sp. JV176]